MNTSSIIRRLPAFILLGIAPMSFSGCDNSVSEPDAIPERLLVKVKLAADYDGPGAEKNASDPSRRIWLSKPADVTITTPEGLTFTIFSKSTQISFRNSRVYDVSVVPADELQPFDVTLDSVITLMRQLGVQIQQFCKMRLIGWRRGAWQFGNKGLYRERLYTSSVLSPNALVEIYLFPHETETQSGWYPQIVFKVFGAENTKMWGSEDNPIYGIKAPPRGIVEVPQGADLPEATIQLGGTFQEITSTRPQWEMPKKGSTALLSSNEARKVDVVMPGGKKYGTLTQMLFITALDGRIDSVHCESLRYAMTVTEAVEHVREALKAWEIEIPDEVRHDLEKWGRVPVQSLPLTTSIELGNDVTLEVQLTVSILDGKAWRATYSFWKGKPM